MKFDDKAFLLSKNKYNENSVIAEFFSKNHGKISGVIFGATSTKIKNFLLIGNHFSIEFNSKNQNRSGYFKVEIEKIFTPHFLEDKMKLSCLLYSLNLIKILTVENQLNQNIYNQLFKLYDILIDEEWIKKFIFWELEVIKFVGYDINFSDYVDFSQLKDNNSYIKTYDGLRQIPSFLLNNNISNISNNELRDGFKVVGDFLNKSVLIPNNISYPSLRNEFIKMI